MIQNSAMSEVRGNIKVMDNYASLWLPVKEGWAGNSITISTPLLYNVSIKDAPLSVIELTCGTDPCCSSGSHLRGRRVLSMLDYKHLWWLRGYLTLGNQRNDINYLTDVTTLPQPLHISPSHIVHNDLTLRVETLLDNGESWAIGNPGWPRFVKNKLASNATSVWRAFAQRSTTVNWG
jgi:hypothetical protein